MKQHVLGFSALVIGVVALGLAVIPGIVLDRPLPLVAGQDEPELPESPEPEIKEGLTFKSKNFSVTFGSSEVDEAKTRERQQQYEKELAAWQAEVKARDQWIKPFTISAVAFSLIRLILGPISWAKENQRAVSGFAIGICCAAILWHYLVIGIAIGVALAIMLIILSMLAG